MLVTHSGKSFQDIFTGFKTSFNSGFQGAKSTYLTIAMEVPSSSAEECYAWMGCAPYIREWLGERVIQNLTVWDYSIKNKDFEATVSISRNHIEDDKYGVFAPLMQEMGQNAATHPDRLCYGLLSDGFHKACYDGKSFFSADHPGVGEGTKKISVSNMQDGTEPAWFLIDSSRIIKPLVFQKRRPYNFVSMTAETDQNVFSKNQFVYGCSGRSNAGYGLWQLAFGSKAPLTHENYEAARMAMTSLKRDDGSKLGVTPTHLIVPNELEGAGRRIVKNDMRLISGVEGNVAISNEWKDSCELLVPAYL